MTEMEVLDDEKLGTVVLRTRTSPMRDATGSIVGAVKVAIDISKEYELAQAKDESFARPRMSSRRRLRSSRPTPRPLSQASRRPTEQQMQGSDPRRRADRRPDQLAARSPRSRGRLLSRSRVPVSSMSWSRVRSRASVRPRAASTSRRCRCASRATRPAPPRDLSILDNALKYSPSDSRRGGAGERQGRRAPPGARPRRRDPATPAVTDLREVLSRPRGHDHRRRRHRRRPVHRAEIVVQHGGRIWFESDSGGTVFSVELPLDVEG